MHDRLGTLSLSSPRDQPPSTSYCRLLRPRRSAAMVFILGIQHWERFRDISQAGILALLPQSHQPLSNIKRGLSSLLQDKGGGRICLVFPLNFRHTLCSSAKNMCAPWDISLNHFGPVRVLDHSPYTKLNCRPFRRILPPSEACHHERIWQ